VTDHLKISYVECTIPPEMTIAAYRTSTRQRPRRSLFSRALRRRPR